MGLQKRSASPATTRVEAIVEFLEGEGLCERLDLHKLREVLGASRTLRLAGEDEIAREFPSLEVGAVPPFGSTAPAVEVIDEKLLRRDRILFPAGDHEHSVLVDPHEVVRVTAAKVAGICQD
jgi:prolyl-tRNA editing enzyme YbaK/EbsC (Cys-tRNA(Pro) deacylase)